MTTNNTFRSRVQVRGTLFVSHVVTAVPNENNPAYGNQYSMAIANPQVIQADDQNAVAILNQYFIKNSNNPEHPGTTFSSYLSEKKLDQSPNYVQCYDAATRSEVVLPHELALGQEVTMLVTVASSTNPNTAKNGNFTTYLNGLIVDNFAELRYYNPGAMGLEGFKSLTPAELAAARQQAQAGAVVDTTQQTFAQPTTQFTGTTQMPAQNGFGGQQAPTATPTANPFGNAGAPQQSVPPVNPFGSGVANGVAQQPAQNPFGGAQSQVPPTNPFGNAGTQPANPFATGQGQAPANPFAAGNGSPFGNANPNSPF